MFSKFRFSGVIKKVSLIAFWLGEHAFLGFMVFLLAAVILASSVFYRYVVTLKDITPDVLPQSGFQSTKFQDILEIWGERQEKFDKATEESARDIFDSGELTSK
jgi:hypothetical protein